jgi:tape measure domain-containing protein
MAANNLGTAYIKIAPQMEGIQGAITKGLQSAAKSSVAGATALGTVVAKGMSTAMNAVTNSMDRAIARVDTLNAFPKIMKNLGFSTEESTSAIEKLSDRIEGLPTGLDEIVNYTQRLASTMGNLNKDVYNATNLAIAFNDAALAGGKGQYEANRAFEQFSQVLSRGRPSMQDWKIMMEVMPGQLKQMAKYMGENNDSLKAYAKQAGKTVDQLDGMDLYNWISENKNEKAKERLQDLTKALIDLDNNGGAGITSFKDQVGDATHTIGNAMSLIPLRVSKAIAKIIDAFGQGDIYTTIDKFTKSFNGIGEWIAKNVVPVIKSTVIPVIKNLMSTVKGIVEYIASNKWLQSTLMGYLNILIAYKGIKTVGGILSSVASGFISIGTALSSKVGSIANIGKFASSLLEAGSAGMSLGDSFKYASLNSGTLGSSIKSLTGTISSLGTAISTIAGVGGIVTSAIWDINAIMTANEMATTSAATAARDYARKVDGVDQATRSLNYALQNEGEILNDIKSKLNEQESAELDYLESKKLAAQYEEEYNNLKAKGTATTDELREAEIKRNAAIKDRDDKQKKLNKTIEESKALEDEYFGNQITGINETNHLITKQELLSGQYRIVAQQLDNLAKSTVTYKDANGNLATATEEQTRQMADWTASRLTSVSDTWKKIYDLSVSEGISLVEATSRIGNDAAYAMDNNFALGVYAYQPLATDASAKSSQAVKNVIDNKMREMNSSGQLSMVRLSEGIKNNVGIVKEAGKSAAQNAKDGANGVTGFWNVGAAFVSGIVKGVNDNKSTLFGTMASVVSTAVQKAKDAGQIHSPSKLTAEIGKFLSLGLAKGIDDYADEAIDAAESMTERTISAMSQDYSPDIGISRLQPQTALTSGMKGSGGQVTQYNTFNVDSELDVKDVSKRLGWQVATAL